MKPIFYSRNNCCLCKSDKIELVVSLPPTPWTSPNFVLEDVEAVGATEISIPLDLYLCQDCGHLQLIHIIDPSAQYANYRYMSSISAGLDKHFDTLVADIMGRFVDAPPRFVFEIGSNDGTVLKKFQKHGVRVLGVDPGRPVVRVAVEAGVPTIADFFTSAFADKVAAEHGLASVIIANNVFANIDDLSDIVRGIACLLAPDGIFVFETGYGADVISKTLLDTVYHEHISYFMVRSLSALFEPHGLEVIDASRNESKGGSIRCFVQKKGGPRPVSGNVAAMVRAELAAGFDGATVFRDFSARIDAIKAKLIAECRSRRKNGPIFGYGASVGTVTLLNFFGIAEFIETIVDDTPLTAELAGPGYRIPVRSSTNLYEAKPGAVVIFAWRYADMILRKHPAYIRDGGAFIIPLPNFRIVE